MRSSRLLPSLFQRPQDLPNVPSAYQRHSPSLSPLEPQQCIYKAMQMIVVHRDALRMLIRAERPTT